MSAIGGSDYIPPTHFSKEGSTTSDRSEAEQMNFALNLMLEMIYLIYPKEEKDPDLSTQVVQVLQNYQQEMKQHPIPLANMIKEFNHVTSLMDDEFLLHFTLWDSSTDKTPPGESFMQWLLSFAQQVAGRWGGNATMAAWVTKIANYINTGPWKANSVNALVQAYFQDLNQLGKDTNGRTFPHQILPFNLFS